jgi:hypothetical protein
LQLPLERESRWRCAPVEMGAAGGQGAWMQGMEQLVHRRGPLVWPPLSWALPLAAVRLLPSCLLHRMTQDCVLTQKT